MPAAIKIDHIIAGLLADTAKTQSPLLPLQEKWAELVGKRLAAYSRPVRIFKGKLFIHVEHPADSYELSFRRRQLESRIKAETQGVVSELVFRTGSLRR